MPQFEYKVVPAPMKGEKAKGVKGTRERFAHTLMALMNELGREGWEYQRADSLPCEERSGLTGKATVFQNVLVFRRLIETPADIAEPVAQVVSEAAQPAEPIQDVPPPATPDPRTPREIAAVAAASLTIEGEESDQPDAATNDSEPSILQELSARRNAGAAAE